MTSGMSGGAMMDGIPSRTGQGSDYFCSSAAKLLLNMEILSALLLPLPLTRVAQVGASSASVGETTQDGP